MKTLQQPIKKTCMMMTLTMNEKGHKLINAMQTENEANEAR